MQLILAMAGFAVLCVLKADENVRANNPLDARVEKTTEQNVCEAGDSLCLLQHAAELFKGENPAGEINKLKHQFREQQSEWNSRWRVKPMTGIPGCRITRWGCIEGGDRWERAQPGLGRSLEQYLHHPCEVEILKQEEVGQIFAYEMVLPPVSSIEFNGHQYNMTNIPAPSVSSTPIKWHPNNSTASSELFGWSLCSEYADVLGRKTNKCIDISGLYTDDSGGTHRLEQANCHGENGDAWRFSVDENRGVLIDAAHVSGSFVEGNETKIVWSNGVIYTRQCVDVAGAYHTTTLKELVTLTQQECVGEAPSYGWTFHITDKTITIDGTILVGTVHIGDPLSIQWSNNVVYTKFR